MSNASSLIFKIDADDIATVNVSGDIDNFSSFGIMGYQGKQGISSIIFMRQISDDQI